MDKNILKNSKAHRERRPQMRIICRLEAVFEEPKMKKQTAKIFFFKF